MELEMIYTTLISVEELNREFSDSRLVIVDCRFSLEDPGLGRRQYQESHIPGAVYAHLDEDLCSPVIPGKTGRHPLPSAENLAEKLEDWGIDSSSKLVAYDDAGGAMAAARFWWLLAWLGHYAVAVLDGGWQAWLESGGETRSGEEVRSSSSFIPRIKRSLLAETGEISRRLADPGIKLVDSRAVERYRGEVEPIDPVAGHIPGAIVSPHQDVLDEQGYFLPRDQLREHFKQLLGKTPAQETIFYCGSGVTAAQNVLAIAHAGLGNARLYAGSWSEWITDPDRPVATGMNT
jgi:thiosulfate/3-mercaptopyruvate sulfurtransferase